MIVSGKIHKTVFGLNQVQITLTAFILKGKQANIHVNKNTTKIREKMVMIKLRLQLRLNQQFQIIPTPKVLQQVIKASYDTRIDVDCSLNFGNLKRNSTSSSLYPGQHYNQCNLLVQVKTSKIIYRLTVSCLFCVYTILVCSRQQ